MKKSSEEICFICGKAPEDFSSNRMFYKHFKMKSHSKESYDCNQCEKKIANHEGLQAHKGKIHSEKFFKCADCGKSFQMKDYLKKHMETHNKYWGISCKFCKKSFETYRKDNFQRHQDKCQSKISFS